MDKVYKLYKRFFKEEYGRWWPDKIEEVDSSKSWNVILGVAHDILRYGPDNANYFIKVFENDDAGKYVWQSDQYYALPNQKSYYELEYRQEFDWRCFAEPELFDEEGEDYD